MSKTTISLSESNSSTSFCNMQEFKEFILKNCIEGSAIAPEILEEALEFHQDVEWNHGGDVSTPIHEELGWWYTRFGHQVKDTLCAAFLRNEDGTLWQAILSIPNGSKPYSYIAPKGNGDRVFFPPIPETIRQKISKKFNIQVPLTGSFWEWLKAQPEIPRIVTEGGKKALSALSLGYPTLALYGCNCGKNYDEPEDESYLKDDLLPFAESDSQWLLALDKDTKPKTVKMVRSSQKKLSNLLKEYDCFVSSMVWRPEDGKGLDDLIANKGESGFEDSYKKAIAKLNKLIAPIAKTGKKPPADDLAKIIAEDYRDKLLFNNESLCWMMYEYEKQGMWSVLTQELLESIVYQIIQSKNIQGIDNYSYVVNVSKFMRSLLIQPKWLEADALEYLPFLNGVLNLKTGELLPHSPGYRLTWQLPRNFNQIDSDWGEIDKFLTHLASNDPNLKLVLICYANAVLKGRYDLQKFLHLIGLGGTGKGTYARLLSAMIGEQNVCTTTLHDFCTNNFDAFNAYGKRLILFADEDRAVGKIGKFLSITGQDPIRAEPKGKKAFNFIFRGMALVCSNMPVFAGETVSRVLRRILTVPCNNPVKKRENLEQKLEAQLGAFTNYILSLSDDFVTSILRGESSPQCNLEFWLNRIRLDGLADWVNDHVVYDPTALTAIGCDKNEGTDGSPVVTLFGSYCVHSKKSGNEQKSIKQFSPSLIELCTSLMGWGVQKKHTSNGKFITGIRLRVVGADDHIPTYEMELENRIKSAKPKDDEHDGSSEGSNDGSKALLHKDSEGYDGSIAILPEIKNQNLHQELEPIPLVIPTQTIDVIPVAGNQSSNPSYSPQSLPAIDSEPSLNPSPNPSLSDEEEKLMVVRMILEMDESPARKHELVEESYADMSAEEKKAIWVQFTKEEQKILQKGKQDRLNPQPVEAIPQPIPQVDHLYKVGDRISCYPNYDYYVEKQRVIATITDIEYSGEYLIQCKIKYTIQRKNTSKIDFKVTWEQIEATSEIGGANLDWIVSKL